LSCDTLSEVLRAVRLTGAVFFDVEASSPWVEQSPAGKVIASTVLPGVQHLISYHVVTEGSCYGGLIGKPPVRLEAGDVIVFPHGDAHVMSSAPGMLSPPKLENYTPPPRTQLPMPVRSGGGGSERTHLVCGFLGCDIRPFNPLISTLPRLLHVRDRDGGARGWLSHFVQVALAESRDKRAGGESVLARLSELMFVQAVRRHLEAMPNEQTGWLAGLRDPYVGRALAVLHERPTHDWSLDELAREASLSRSALADRFGRLVGQPPMTYLAQWRMQIAAGLLARGAKVSAVATEVGYESEAAFNRAFKRFVGIPPATWRDSAPLTSRLSKPPASSSATAAATVIGREAPANGRSPSPATKRPISSSKRPASAPARRAAAGRARTRTTPAPRPGGSPR
jgi:AraC-like DNA-binding protein